MALQGLDVGPVSVAERLRAPETDDEPDVTVTEADQVRHGDLGHPPIVATDGVAVRALDQALGEHDRHQTGDMSERGGIRAGGRRR